jgi:hypothetical protein
MEASRQIAGPINFTSYDLKVSLELARANYLRALRLFLEGLLFVAFSIAIYYLINMGLIDARRIDPRRVSLIIVSAPFALLGLHICYSAYKLRQRALRQIWTARDLIESVAYDSSQA